MGNQTKNANTQINRNIQHESMILGKTISEESMKQFHKDFGLKLNPYYDGVGEKRIKKQVNFIDVWIYNKTSRPLLHLFLIHRCSRVTPHQRNLYYKKILNKESEQPIQNWPFIQDPYDPGNIKIVEKDIFQIYFSIQISGKIIPWTNLGLTNISIEVPTASVKNTMLKVSIIQLKQQKLIIGEIKTNYNQTKPTTISLVKNENFLKLREEENQKIKNSMQQQANQKNFTELLLDLNYKSKLLFVAYPQILALKIYQLRNKQQKQKQIFESYIEEIKYLFEDLNPPLISINSKYYPTKLIMKSFQKDDQLKSQSQSGSLGQMYLGDCYLIATLEQFISKATRALDEILIFQAKDINYTCIILNVDGHWIPIQVDQDLPIQKQQEQAKNRKICYSYSYPRKEKSQSISSYVRKAMFIQKCLAKVYRSYANLVSGQPKQIFMAVASINTQSYQTSQRYRNDLITKMLRWNNNENSNIKVLIVIESPQYDQHKIQRNEIVKLYLKQKFQLFYKHSYSFYGLSVIPKKGQDPQLKIVRLRHSIKDRAQFWMKSWQKENKIQYNRWLQYNQKQFQYDFLIYFDDLMKIQMTVWISEYLQDNKYIPIPVLMEDSKKSRLQIKIINAGQYYFSIHKKNVRHDLQSLYQEYLNADNTKYKQSIVDEIKERRKKHQYLKAKLILRKKGLKQTIQVQDYLFNQLITYLKCYLEPGQYTLQAGFYGIEEKQKEALIVSALGNGIESMYEVYLHTDQTSEIQFYEKASIDIQVQNVGQVTKQRIFRQNLQYIVECKDEIWDAFCLTIISSQILKALQNYNKQPKNQKISGNKLLKFTMEKIDDYKFQDIDKWEGQLTCTHYHQFKSKNGEDKLLFLLQHKHKFRKGKYRLKIKLNKKFQKLLGYINQAIFTTIAQCKKLQSMEFYVSYQQLPIQ